MIDVDVGRSLDREKPGFPSQPVPVAMTVVRMSLLDGSHDPRNPTLNVSTLPR